MIADFNERKKALDISQSFIVQAPAGSGKTELLTQRFLALLSKVEVPESIIAITFTKKAASEMKRRILDALFLAESNEIPDDDHKKTTYLLAKNVLKNNQKYNWQLLQNPNRLEITTIDALCLKLVRSMPLLSGFLSVPQISDNLELLYENAVDELIFDLKKEHPQFESFRLVLSHLDNNLTMLITLLTEMLKKREQWLSLVLAYQNHKNNHQHDLKNSLQKSFEILAEINIKNLFIYLSDFKNDLEEIINFCLTFIENNEKMHKNIILNDKLSSLTNWQSVIEILLLTKENKFRKRLTKKEGFLAVKDIKEKHLKDKTKAYKEKALLILETLQNHPQSELILNLLIDVKNVSIRYEIEDWRILNAIIELLILAAQYLKLNFLKTNSVDFSEIAIEALSSLGDEQNPTDLMLYLDYKIEHLLVDEFQDTSKLQFSLLQSLTCGWQQGDGRSLFLVGDPMQSIYRFRQAEVELFLNAEKNGIGDIKLQKLNLSTNFRSEFGIISWVNAHFKTIFPANNAPEVGAISYLASTYPKKIQHSENNEKNKNNTLNTNVKLFSVNDEKEEADAIADLIKSKLEKSKKIKIAILAKSRNHLGNILQSLKKHQILYNETEIDQLYHQAIIEDLLALTETICQKGDLLAITKLLNSRLFGLNLSIIDRLFALFKTKEMLNFTLFLDNLINHNQLINILNEKKDENKINKQIEKRILTLIYAMSHAYSESLSQLVENTFNALNGYDYYDLASFEYARTFFKILKAHETKGHLTDIEQLKAALEKAKISRNNKAQVEILTIHKSKGLEFDIVIIPSLHRKNKPNDQPLLQYDYFEDEKNTQRILLAPKKNIKDNEASKLYQLIAKNHQKRLNFEESRLLYVAATRAKSKLYLFACFNNKNDEQTDVKVTKQSLLEKLYPVTQNKWQSYFNDAKNYQNLAENDNGTKTFQSYYYLANHQDLLALENKKIPENNIPEAFDYFKIESQIMGNVIHQVFESLITQKKYQNNLPDDLTLIKKIKQQLLIEGFFDRENLTEKTQHILKAIKQSLTDSPLIKLFNQASEIYSEYSFYHLNKKKKLNHSIVDLLLINKTNNTIEINIIDYKTSQPQNNQSKEDFLAEEKSTYLEQLKRYHYLASTYFQTKKVNTYLFFPILNHLEKC